MQIVAGYAEKGYRIQDVLAAAGLWICRIDDAIYANDAAGVLRVVADYDPLPDAKAARLAAVELELARRLAEPFAHGESGFQIDAASQARITAQGALAAASLANPDLVPWPADFQWIAADNRRVAMSAAAMLSFAAAAAAHVRGLAVAARTKKDAILALDTVAVVEAADPVAW